MTLRETVAPARGAAAAGGIVIDGLVKRYGDVLAVDGLNLAIEKGELFALLGPNGAGKTTTIKVLCGLLDPTSGQASIGGLDVHRQMDKIKRVIGVCPQESSTFPYLTGKENVELFGELHGLPKATLKERVSEIIGKLFLEDHAGRLAQKYSGGLNKRVSLAMALVNDPDFLFLDEPTVAMDPQSRRAIWEYLKEIKARGKTIVLTTHYMEEAEHLADRIGIIDRGKLIALGSPARLMEANGCDNFEDVFIKLTGRDIRKEEV
ncbi:MAG: ATP-binding cassette domain-containing protein [Candidatus Lokiarchaeota archaeon]|nr:ATP-binding cassette domain-containing protein [Candidatus Lokiarchaeota archaeon]